MSQPSNRIDWIDLCRVASIFGVILIHASAVVVQDFGRIPLPYFVSGVVLDSIVRASVPLFVMISGALLVPSGFSINPTRRVLKIILPLLFWSLVYQEWVNYWTGSRFDLLDALQRIVNGPTMYHLWFAYMILGLYFLLPIFQILLPKLLSSKSFAIYLLLLWLLVNSIPTFYSLPILQHVQVNALAGYSGYFLLGAYLGQRTRVPNHHRWRWFVLFLGGVACTALLTILWTIRDGRPNETAFAYFFPSVILSAVALFQIFSGVKLDERIAYPVSKLSVVCFPIYFMHLMMLDILRGGLMGFAVTPYMFHPGLALLLWAGATFFVCAAVAAVFRLLPGAARVMG